MLHSWQQKTNHNMHTSPNSSLTAATPTTILADLRQLTHVKWNDATNTYDTFSLPLHQHFPVWSTRPLVQYHHPPPVPPLLPQKQCTSTLATQAPMATSLPSSNRAVPSTLHFDANPGIFAQATRITHQQMHDNYEKPAYSTTHGSWQKTYILS